MSHRPGIFSRLVRLTLVTCVRGLVQAVVSLAGLLLFAASVISLFSLAAGIGILLAPRSLLAVRGLASTQRVWAPALVGSADRDAVPAPAGRAHQRADRAAAALQVAADRSRDLA